MAIVAVLVIIVLVAVADRLGLATAGGMEAILVVVGVLVVAGLFARVTVFSGMQVRRMRWRIYLRMRPGKGFASLAEMVVRWSRWAAICGHGRRARPSMGFWARLISPVTQFAVRLGRGPFLLALYARAEDAGLVVAPPRVGKSAMMAGHAIDHPGAALITETRPDIFEASAGYRSLGGRPVHLFNPEGVGGYLSTLKWAMTAGCQNPAEAIRRANDLVGAAVQGAGEMQWWVEKSASALGAGMHAAGLARDAADDARFTPAERSARDTIAGVMHGAAVAGADMRDVYAWANAPSAGAELVRAAMRDERASQALFHALTELDKPGKTADSIRITMSKSLMWLGIPALAAMVTGPGAAEFDVPEFIDRRGTVYMLTEGGDDAPGAPLFRCFASYVHRQARAYSQTLPGRRLDPRLLFLLDELHMCPVNLPRWTADSAGFGIDIWAVVQTLAQLVEKYGEAGAKVVWQNCTTKVFLPGNQDTDLLTQVRMLGGNLPGDAGDGRNDWVIPAELVTRLPNWRALVFRGNLTPVIVKTRPYWRRLGFRFRQNPPLPAELRPPWLRMPSAGDIEAELAEWALEDYAPAVPARRNGDTPEAGDRLG